MRFPSLRRSPIPATAVATMCGVVLGVLTFVLSAWLHRVGATEVAALTAEAALLAALVCVAGFTIFDGPSQLRRARVPIGRALPPSWWPRETESMTVLAACVGAPLVIGAGAAVLLFR